MKSRLILASLALLCTLSIGVPSARAYTSPGVPVGYVNDFAHVLSEQTIQGLNMSLAAFEASTSNEISVVTVPNMGGDYIENYAVKLFAEWGIGKKDKDNGVLLLLAIGEHKLRIEVGYGLEGALPDSVAQRIISDEITPALKSGDYDTAVVAGVTSIVKATMGEYVGTGSTVSSLPHFSFDTWMAILFLPLIALQWLGAILARSKSWWAGGVVGLVAGLGISAVFGFVAAVTVVLVVVLSVFGLILDFIVSSAYTGAKSSGVGVPWWAGGGSSHSSSGGGGFGGFGGGSSGGGGASGSW